MKTIDQIRKLTEKANKDKTEQKRLIAIRQKKEAAAERKEMIENAQDVSFFEEAIENAAKAGKNTYTVSLGRTDDDSEYFKIHKKAITDTLKEFHPTFTIGREEGCERDWEGCPIDGTEYTYSVVIVTFNW